MTSAAADRPLPDVDGFHALRIAEVRHEAADSVSLILMVPPPLVDRFAYRAGQFVTIRVEIDGRRHDRCYSMSSAPETDPAIRITIRRIAGGLVSHWIGDHVLAGDMIAVAPPAGRFCLRDTADPLMLYAAGSGITPILSLAKAALAAGTRPVSLFHADRDRGSLLFGDELTALAAAHAGRLTMVRWLDAERGLPTAKAIAALLPPVAAADHHVCGPDAFITIVEGMMTGAGVAADRILTERFVSLAEAGGAGAAAPETPAPPEELAPCETLTVTLAGETHVLPCRAGETILEAAWRGGLRPPVSCLRGGCATCVARVVQGAVRMHANDVLSEKEVAQGYVLTCQSEPIGRAVAVVYED